MRLRKIKINKKAQVNTLAPAILALVFAGIVLVFGVIMSQELRDTQDGVESTSVTNETLEIQGTGQGTGITAEHSHSDDCGYSSWNATLVMNCTTGANCPDPDNVTLVEGTDYVINANGSITNMTVVFTPLTVGYAYNWGGIACEGANATVVGLGTFADFWEIIVLAIVITVVIGLLLVIFGGAGARRSR